MFWLCAIPDATGMNSYLPAPRHALLTASHESPPTEVSSHDTWKETPKKKPKAKRRKKKEEEKKTRISVDRGRQLRYTEGRSQRSSRMLQSGDIIRYMGKFAIAVVCKRHRGLVIPQGQGWGHGRGAVAVGGETSWLCPLKMYRPSAIHRFLRASMCPFLPPRRRSCTVLAIRRIIFETCPFHTWYRVVIKPVLLLVLRYEYHVSRHGAGSFKSLALKVESSHFKIFIPTLYLTSPRC